MMTRLVVDRTIVWKLTWLGIAAAWLAVAAAPSSAQTEPNLTGAYAGVTSPGYDPGPPPTLTLDIAATGFATQLGHFTLVGQQVVNLPTGTYTGSYTFTVTGGDTLTATTAGIRLLCLASGAFSLQESFTITGGTGRFAGATGEGTGLGVFGSATDQIALVFSGTLSTSPTGR